MSNSRDKKLYNKTKFTVTGWMNTIYKRMQQRNRKKFAKDLPFDRCDFEMWILTSNFDKFFNLFVDWQNSNYKSNLKPSVDRIDYLKPYTFDNMQIITWEQNNKKGNVEKREIGVNHMTTITKKPVKQFDIDGNFIKKYESLSEASRETSVSTSVICECCQGKRKTGKGYRWIYA